MSLACVVFVYTTSHFTEAQLAFHNYCKGTTGPISTRTADTTGTRGTEAVRYKQALQSQAVTYSEPDSGVSHPSYGVRLSKSAAWVSFCGHSDAPFRCHILNTNPSFPNVLSEFVFNHVSTWSSHPGCFVYIPHTVFLIAD